MSLLMILALSPAVPAHPLPEAAKPSLQSDFNAATDAALAGDCGKAIPLFEALEHNPAVKSGSFAAASIALRKGSCLVRWGRTAEGETAILAGLPPVERAGADFADDIAEGYMRLGNAAFGRWDYGEAKRRYEKALSFNVTPLQQPILAELIKATTFDDGPDALRYADEGIRLVSAKAKPPKDALATFYTLKARILLNRGEAEKAYALLREALNLSGGLTSRTTLGEASMRGDLALAALLLGKKDDARRYLAYTGAGRIVNSPFATAASMAAPDCGEDTGLRPDDFAVVEFGIADDGSVSRAQTVHSRGGPRVAAAFARAVSQWYWWPEALAKVPPFYKLATRVELRCSTAGGPSPGTQKPLSDRFRAWASTRISLPNLDNPSRSNLIDGLRRELTEHERSGDAGGQIAAIGLLAIVDPRTNAETVANLDRAIALSGSAHIPVATVNALRIFRLLTSPFARVKGKNARIGKLATDQLLALAQDPTIAADSLAAATLRLLDPEIPSPLLEKIANDERLPSGHPLRQLAWLKLANRAATSGDLASAQLSFAKTGLTEQQCAMIGARPALRKSGANSGDFPREAMEYGFEGWVNLEFDITADGQTANARPVVAYPPFVFVDAAKKMTHDVRYEASYRPSGGVACSANHQTIRFMLPYLRN